MARPLDQEKRKELLSNVVDYMAVDGLSDLSLRQVAASLGTTSRMLVYYFGTKEKLLTEALATQHPNLAEMFVDVRDPASLREALIALWTTMLGDNDTSRSTRLLLQAMGIAVVREGPFAEFATRTIAEVTSGVTAAIVRAGAQEQTAADLATIAISGLRGALMDYLITADAQRTDRAARHLVELIVDDVATE
ncbi:TetR family transcriptional regulator [Actinomycetes bacterium M1A6_2h]